jgi:hypothetical protein
MPKYLRDVEVRDLTIDRDALEELADEFIQRGFLMPEYRPVENGKVSTVWLYYTIRFDARGYRVYSKEELFAHYDKAKEVERITVDLRSDENIKTNGNVGSYTTLRLDTSESAAWFLTVASDNEEWVNGTFSAINEKLAKNKNRHAWFRNPIVDLLIRLLGLVAGFLVSVWGASIISPKLEIENSFLISFLLILIIFSNLWTPINNLLLNLLSRTFPRIRFYRPKRDRFHWLGQTVVGGIVVALTLYLLGLAFGYMGDILGGFIRSGA